jgi:hypothetical protein
MAITNETKKMAEYVDGNLQNPRPSGTVERDPFHWPLAVPEVFVDTTSPGFDAIIGNPPFLGGSKVSGTYGDDYLSWLQRWDGNDVKGSTDLSARFVLRVDRLLSARGQLGYVTTNTLIEGTTLRVGLIPATERSLTIRSGRSSHPWPTKSANLQVIEIWASRAKLSRGATLWLDGEEVPAIGPDLQPFGRIKGRPKPLRENESITFPGSKILGLGFTLSSDEADSLIAHDPRNKHVVLPYINGKDLNKRPDCSGSRWIINFRDWPLDRAESYPDCMAIVRQRVKPERDRYTDMRRHAWWQYERIRPELYATISALDRVIAIAQTSSTVMPVVIPTGQVFDQSCIIFARNDYSTLSMISSSIHSTWVVRYTTVMRTDIRYLPSHTFATLPRPQPTEELTPLGRRLDESRRKLMLSRAWGLTRTYKRVHDPDNHEPAIQELRDIHVAIDEAVMRAYGWEDLDLKIGHHPTKIGIRWTVSKEARFELLDRLLEENHRRYELENPS